MNDVELAGSNFVGSFAIVFISHIDHIKRCIKITETSKMFGGAASQTNEVKKPFDF